MLEAQKEELKFNKKLLNNNWITEKWVPYEVDLDPLVKQKLKSSSTVQTFLRSQLLKLSWSKVEVKSPVFIHWEFDNWHPWFIPEDNGKWKTSFMAPVGTWRFFFSSNMSTTLTSSCHRLQEGIEGPTNLQITFDNRFQNQTTVELKVSGFNEAYITDNLLEID